MSAKLYFKDKDGNIRKIPRGGGSLPQPEQIKPIVEEVFEEHKSEFVTPNNVKTINGQSIIGKGNITISGSEIINKIEDTSGFSKTSVELAHDMGIGYNIGDYLDSFNARYWAYIKPADVKDDVLYNETLWGNPSVNNEFIKYLHNELGIGAIRLPVTWTQFIDTNNNMVDERLLQRVKEIVTYIINNDMYCIINIHHDGIFKQWTQWNYMRLDSANMLRTKSHACNLWKQIADYFSNFGYKLIFETFNEVCDSSGSMSATQARTAYANELNQAIINVIRESGGNNANRFIACANYGGVSFNNGISSLVDSATDKLMKCSHEYPIGNASTGWCSMSDGIGAYMGEVGWKFDNSNRATYLSNLRRISDETKAPFFLWDNGARDYSLINRLYNQSTDKASLEAYIGKTLQEKIFLYNDIPSANEPYIAEFYTPDFANVYGAKYVIIASAKPIVKVDKSTMSSSVGYYKIIGMESGSITMYISNDGISYTRTLSRIATVFAEIRDDFHILGSTENTILKQSNYSIDFTPTSVVKCTNVSLDAETLSFNDYTSQTLVATVQPSNCTEEIMWETDNALIATVDNGVVTPIANGSCNIIVTCGDFADTCSVNVDIQDEPQPPEPSYETVYEWNGTDELTDGFVLGDTMKIVNSSEYGNYITSTSAYSNSSRGIRLNDIDAFVVGSRVEAEFVILSDLTQNAVNERVYASVATGNSKISATHTIKGNGVNTGLFTNAGIEENVGTRFRLSMSLLSVTLKTYELKILDINNNILYEETKNLSSSGSSIPNTTGAYANSNIGITRIKVTVPNSQSEET